MIAGDAKEFAGVNNRIQLAEAEAVMVSKKDKSFPYGKRSHYDGPQRGHISRQE